MLALISSLLSYPATRQEIINVASSFGDTEHVGRLLAEVDSMLASLSEFVDRTNRVHHPNTVCMAVQVKGACLDLRIAAQRYREVGWSGERLATLFQELADWLEMTFDPDDAWNHRGN